MSRTFKNHSHASATLEASVEEGRARVARGDFYTQRQIEAEDAKLLEKIMEKKC